MTITEPFVHNLPWLNAIKKILIADEAKAPKPYNDATGKPPVLTKGKLTIGVGRNLTDVGLSDDEISLLLENDIKRVVADCIELFELSKWKTWSKVRQHGLVSLVFNLGKAGLLKFFQTYPAIKAENWELVAELLKKTKWARDIDPKQRPGIGRDDRIINMICYEKYDKFYMLP